MAFHLYIAGTEVTSVTDRPSISVVVQAHQGTPSQGKVLLHNDAGTMSVPGRKQWKFSEDGSGTERYLGAGRISYKDLARGAVMFGSANTIAPQLDDVNADLLGIRAGGWVRPSETDVARVLACVSAFLNGSPRASTVIGTAYVPNTNTVTMAATTYAKGQTPYDILNDCAGQSGKDFFVIVNDAGTFDLFYDLPTSTAYAASGFAVTDASPDGSSSFAPIWQGSADYQDPSELMSGLEVGYTTTGGTTGSAYVTDAGTASTYDWWETYVQDDRASSAATATARANALLTQQKVEIDTFRFWVRLTSAQVHLIKAGMTFAFRAAAAGVTSPRTVRAARVNYQTPVEGQYLVYVEAGFPQKLGARISNYLNPSTGGTSTAAAPPATTNTNVDGSCGVTIGPPTTFGGVGAFELSSWGTGAQLADSSGLGSNGCDIGDTRWYGGPTSGAAYHSIAVSCKGTGALVLRLTMTATLQDRLSQGPVNDFGYYAYLWSSVPTALDGGILLGSFHTGAMTLDIPANLLPASGTAYVEFSPVSRVFQGPICINNFGTPAKDEKGLAYGYIEAASPVAHWMALDAGQTAMADWLPVIEAPDGARVTFTLAGWDGTGTPQVLVNGLAASVVATDTSALTVTLAAPPSAGSLVLARYPVAT